MLLKREVRVPLSPLHPLRRCCRQAAVSPNLARPRQRRSLQVHASEQNATNDSLLSRGLQFVDSQFLPVFLVLSLLAGNAFPSIAVAAAKADAASIATTAIFIISGAHRNIHVG